MGGIRGLRLAVSLLAMVATLAFAAPASALSNYPDRTWMTNGAVHAIAKAGNVIYIGGKFTELRSSGAADATVIPVQNLAAVDATTGKGISTWKPQANGTVYALATSPTGDKVYAGGAFTTVNGQTASKLAALHPSTGALDTTFRGRLWSGDTTSVRALLTTPTRIYLGGHFTSVNGIARNRLAALDYTGRLDAAWDPSANGGVLELALSPDGSDLYAAGHFTSIDGLPRQRLARVDAATGELDLWNPAVPVGGDYGNGLAVTATHVFIGFSGSQHLDSYDTVTGGQLWTFHLGGDIKTLTLWGHRVVFGGHFTTIRDEFGNSWKRPRIASVGFDGSVHEDWIPYITGDWDGPYALHATGAGPGSQLYIGGSFKYLSGRAQHWFGRFTE